MSKDDYVGELLWEHMLRRKNAFLNAMRASDVLLLPRVRVRDRTLKRSQCPFYEKCMYKDDETGQAQAMANDLDLINVRGFLFCG
jgi:hypothetical protein